MSKKGVMGKRAAFDRGLAERQTVTHEALAEHLFYRARLNALGKIGLTEKDAPHVNWEGTDQESWLSDADAILAAGFRRPAPVEVTTVEELDALPSTSAILYETPIQTVVMQKSVHDGFWYLPGNAHPVLPGWPARVLFRPDTEAPELAPSPTENGEKR